MSEYRILYSDPAKNSSPIVVADGSLNKNSTSLTLVGRNYPGYGETVETDLVHLLENFAASSPPSNPIEGQLWFDTSDPTAKILKINDGGISGSRWSPINGVFQQPGQPSNVKTGDIWVDTANQQLKFFNGTDFTLVGPDFSGGSRTGSYPQTLTDTVAQPHNVIINYVNDEAIEIISASNFTPNPVINGFGSLKPGLNISSSNVGTISNPVYPRINGIAESAYNLQISIPTSQKITADAFLRNDIDQRMVGSLNIANDNNSLKIGVDPTFLLYRSTIGNKAVFSNIQNNGQFNFLINDASGTPNNVLTMLGEKKYVGINNSGPQCELDVIGALNVTTSATVNTLYVTSTTGTLDTVVGNAVQVAGGVGISGTLVVTGEHILRGPLSVGETNIPSIVPNDSQYSIVLPTKDAIYNMGDSNLRWKAVYANTFLATNSGTQAQFVGNATSATKLSTAKNFYLTGDMTAPTISFDGSSYNNIFTATAQTTLITGKANTSTTVATDSILVYSTGTNKLFQQTKKDFLKDVNYQDPNVAVGYSTPSGSLVPVGTIIAFAGSVAPAGWLLCNGQAVSISDIQYHYLCTAILAGYPFGGSSSSYNLPNLPDLASGIKYIIKY